MVPKGWKQLELGEIATIISGGTPGKGKADFWGGSIPWYTAKDLKWFRLRDSLHHLTELGSRSGARKVPGNTILILVRGMTLHKDVPVGLTPCSSTFNQDLKAISGRTGVSNDYLAYFLAFRKHVLRGFVDHSGHGTGRLQSDYLRNLPILVPPPTEQQQIVSILARWDLAIEQVSKLIGAKTRLKKGLMQQLLTGRRRFPGYEACTWRKVKLGEVFSERSESNRQDLPLLSVTSDRGIIPRDEVDRKDTSTDDKSAYKRIARGDIGYNTMRMWQGVSALSELEGIVSPAYTVVTPGPDVDALFAAYFFKFPPMVHRFRRFSQGLVDDTLNLKYNSFAHIRAELPSVQEQRKVGDALLSVDKSIASMIELKGRLQEQKRGLMQVLLTGRVRVGGKAGQHK